MTFNHRIVRTPGTPHDDPDFEVREVYYDADGAPRSMTAKPVTFGGRSASDVVASLRRAANSIEKYGELVPPEGWILPPGPAR